MRRAFPLAHFAFASLVLGGLPALWSGCAEPQQQNTGGGTTTTTTTTMQGTGGSGGSGPSTGGGSTDTDAGVCTSTSAKAERVPLDMVFLIDRSTSMVGAKWSGTINALTAFFNDPASSKIAVGLNFFPNFSPDFCDANGYKTLHVPVAPLPGNAFNLTNSLPAEPAGPGTPTYPALEGTLMVATALQDANPTHKVVVVLATDGDPHLCPITDINLVADLAKSARAYNGVHTYVVGVEGSTIANLNKIAEAGGTGTAYDITNDIAEFSAKIAEIRNAALGCEFDLPPPPNGEDLDPNKVNFSYTPGGIGEPDTLLRANDLADCNGKPGWYFDDNTSPTKIILCPASCATVQADTKAEVNALFGCKSQLN